jgi:hypothetical protein
MLPLHYHPTYKPTLNQANPKPSKGLMVGKESMEML